MAREKSELQWQHTRVVSAILINAHRPKGQKAVTPDDLKPYVEKKKKQRLAPTEESKAAISKMLGIQ